jgi:hypothetical protein
VDVAKIAVELRSVVDDITYDLTILDASFTDGEGTGGALVRGPRREWSPGSNSGLSC